MEAKVDIQKLQLLNDRISQTIDALNQVRMSVHGISNQAQFAAPQQQAYPFAGGLYHSNPMQPTVPYGAVPQNLAWLAQMNPALVYGGLAHTDVTRFGQTFPYAFVSQPGMW